MKKLLFVSVLAVIGLSACGSTPAPEVTKTVIQQVPTVSNQTSDELAMVASIRNQNSYFDNVDTQQIIDVAYQFCTALRSGTSLEELGQIGANTIGSEQLAVLGAGAIVYLCPDQSYRVS